MQTSNNRIQCIKLYSLEQYDAMAIRREEPNTVRPPSDDTISIEFKFTLVKPCDNFLHEHKINCKLRAMDEFKYNWRSKKIEK